MDNRDVAHLLTQIASFLELKGENPFRVRAYTTAARALTGFHGDLESALAAGEIAGLKGVGPAMQEIIQEAVTTGRATALDDLRREIPSGLVEMMKIPGLGVAKIRQIHRELGITTLGALEEAARDGRLARLPRFGPRTAEKILKSVSRLRQVSDYRLFHHARRDALQLAAALQELPGVIRVTLAGSIRRRCEIIRDLDFVVETDEPTQHLADRLGMLVGVSEFVGRGEGHFTLQFSSNTVADIYACSPRNAGFVLVRATGSGEHLTGVRARACAVGYNWTPDGITRDGTLVPCATEEEFYELLGMSFVPPELREGRDEIQAAIDHRLPSLIAPSDIRGFLHCHSNYSDGTSTMRDWAVGGSEAGYEYVGITDHSVAALYAGGLYAETIGQQHEEIDQVNAEGHQATLLKGVEVDILEDGALDYDPETRARFDFVIASIHNGYGQGESEMTQRVLRAMDDPTMTIFGHPTGRLLLSREPYPMDLEAIFDKAAEVGVAIEINADPQRLDLDWRVVRTAVARGVTISIGADAHNTTEMANMQLGIGIAHKGWLGPEQVLNTRSMPDFLEFVANRRGHRAR